MAAHGCISCRFPGCRAWSCPICHPKEHEHNVQEWRAITKPSFTAGGSENAPDLPSRADAATARAEKLESELTASRDELATARKRTEELEGWRDKMRDRYDALALVLEKIASERDAAREACLYAIGCIDGTIRDYADKLPKLLRSALAGADKEKEPKE